MNLNSSLRSETKIIKVCPGKAVSGQTRRIISRNKKVAKRKTLVLNWRYIVGY